jgi:hypothetical protein
LNECEDGGGSSNFINFIGSRLSGVGFCQLRLSLIGNRCLAVKSVGEFVCDYYSMVNSGIDPLSGEDFAKAVFQPAPHSLQLQVSAGFDTLEKSSNFSE